MTKPTFDYAKDKGVTDKLGRLNPLRRAAQPEELAQVALFLASEQSSSVNGQAIAVDGGLSSSHPVTQHGPQARFRKRNNRQMAQDRELRCRKDRNGMLV
jgi:hypothetical protein